MFNAAISRRFLVGVGLLAVAIVAILVFISLPNADTTSEEKLEPGPPFGPATQPPVLGRLREPDTTSDEVVRAGSSVTPFTDIASKPLDGSYGLWNDRPGVVVFDYDRDGDLDVYITSAGGHPNLLYRNEGDGTFTDVAARAGVAASKSHSTGAVACDVDNDGYQDLYVGAWGSPYDNLDFRSPSDDQGNKDVLFRNRGDGTFEDVTDQAFGDEVNLRSASSAACADVDGDGWLDVFVGNLMAGDFRWLDRPNHPGHYNMLYRNNGDLTFTEVSEPAGVRGPQIPMRLPNGQPILFEDPETGRKYEGYDPTVDDALGNPVGEPTGQTHAVLFFDYDDDGDPDLWVANDGDRFHLFRNDSSPGEVRFTPAARPMGIDRVGSWMGFAVGDYDGDADLDVFVTNIGYHPRTRTALTSPGGSCEYHERFARGTCLHFLLRNEGTREIPGLGTIGLFQDVAASTVVVPSPYMPSPALDPKSIHPSQIVPTGLTAYEFGFGATFFDYDNDADQDLYWLGSTEDAGEAPLGQVFPSAGRMLAGRGGGSFEDITVRAHLLDIVDVGYSRMGQGSSNHDLRISAEFHENGKGLAHGDFNGDGYVDLVATNSSGLKFGPGGAAGELVHEPGPLFLWMNGGGQNRWITLRLKGRMSIDGTGSNADGIGARVYVKTDRKGRDQPLVQVQEVRAGSSYLSMDSIDLEFGLGDATVVDQITVLWPSGRRQVLNNVSIDQILTVTEPEP